MATPPFDRSRRTTQPEALTEGDLDAGYAQLVSAFNSDAANAERRTARDRYARRSDDQL